jgi:hypothetical protein
LEQAKEQARQFNDAIRQAYKRVTRPLIRYLLSEAPLTDEQRSQLAALIRRRLQHHGKVGHPKGPSEYGSKPDARRYAVFLMRNELKRLWRLHGKPLPKGMRDKVFEDTMDRPEFEDVMWDDADILQMKNTIRRGEKNTSN